MDCKIYSKNCEFQHFDENSNQSGISSQIILLNSLMSSSSYRLMLYTRLVRFFRTFKISLSHFNIFFPILECSQIVPLAKHSKWIPECRIFKHKHQICKTLHFASSLLSFEYKKDYSIMAEMSATRLSRF